MLLTMQHVEKEKFAELISRGPFAEEMRCAHGTV
jgi:hypothetical protein